MKHKEELGGPLTLDEDEISARVTSDEILERLQRSYREELIDRGVMDGEKKSIRIHLLDQVEFDYTLLDSPSRAVPVQNGIGAIDAVINPLIAYREGRYYVDGNTIGFETTHRAQLSKYFSIYARPRFEVLVPNTGSTDVNPIVQQLYGKFAYRNFELEAGRDSLIWGQGEFGGVLASNNARPLDMIKLTTSGPFYHPWIFKYLGPSKYTFFVANLGPEREFPYSYLTGLKVSIKPVSFFEVGFDHVMVLGGDGAPGISTGGVIGEFFLQRVGDVSTVNNVNHQVGFDLRFWLPFLRNSQVYLDMQIEDKETGTPLFMFTGLASYQVGLFLPRLTSDGSIDLRLEYRHGSPFFYRHGLFVTGMALNQRLWGDELGPDGDGAYLSFSDQLSDKVLIRSSFRYERRGSDILTQVEDADSTHRHLVLIASGITESRFGWNVGGSYRFNESISVSLNLGYERVANFNFVQGDDENNFIGGLNLSFSPNIP